MSEFVAQYFIAKFTWKIVSSCIWTLQLMMMMMMVMMIVFKFTALFDHQLYKDISSIFSLPILSPLQHCHRNLKDMIGKSEKCLMNIVPREGKCSISIYIVLTASFW
jgi:hypothetical protein